MLLPCNRNIIEINNKDNHRVTLNLCHPHCILNANSEDYFWSEKQQKSRMDFTCMAVTLPFAKGVKASETKESSRQPELLYLRFRRNSILRRRVVSQYTYISSCVI
jgi:hypothetical protein